MCFFFFQAEDGIRDYKVTGVQTCALPIWGFRPAIRSCASATWRSRLSAASWPRNASGRTPARSEERRVGKECSARGGPDEGKKKERKRLRGNERTNHESRERGGREERKRE